MFNYRSRCSKSPPSNKRHLSLFHVCQQDTRGRLLERVRYCRKNKRAAWFVEHLSTSIVLFVFSHKQTNIGSSSSFKWIPRNCTQSEAYRIFIVFLPSVIHVHSRSLVLTATVIMRVVTHSSELSDRRHDVVMASVSVTEHCAAMTSFLTAFMWLERGFIARNVTLHTQCWVLGLISCFAPPKQRLRFTLTSRQDRMCCRTCSKTLIVCRPSLARLVCSALLLLTQLSHATRRFKTSNHGLLYRSDTVHLSCDDVAMLLLSQLIVEVLHCSGRLSFVCFHASTEHVPLWPQCINYVSLLMHFHDILILFLLQAMERLASLIREEVSATAWWRHCLQDGRR